MNIGRSQGENDKVCEPLECGQAPIFKITTQNGGDRVHASVGVETSTALSTDIQKEQYFSESFCRRFKDYLDVVRGNVTDGTANRGKILEFYEPVFMLITNFFGDVTYDTLLSWSPWRGFSQSIPHCNNVN